MRINKLAIWTVCLLAASLYLKAGAAENQTARRKAEQLFKENDKNGDGKLSREEFPARFKGTFDRVDANKDDFLTLEEDIAYRIRKQSAQPRTAPSRSAGNQPNSGERVERDIVYSRLGERELKLDVYRPGKAEGPLPVVMWIHGGGWKGGSKGSGGRARGMVARGYAIVDVEYRLSGEALFPAQIVDCKTAVRWVRANAEKYGFDPDRIGAWGTSAGGHLVALMGTSGGVEEFESKEHAGHSSRVQAVCDWFGPTDLLQMDAHMLEGSRLGHDDADSPESRLVGGPIQEEPYRSICKKVNPITYVTKDDPPFLIVHGDRDMLVPHHQSQILHEALRKAKVKTTYRLVKGAGHGLRDGTEISQEELIEQAIRFFNQHLKTKK